MKIVIVKPAAVPYLLPKSTGFGAGVNRFYPVKCIELYNKHTINIGGTNEV